MDLTFKIAIYGAILSTLNAVIYILNYRRDRADLRITVKGNMAVYPKDRIYGDKTYVSIDVANKGRRPVTITKCAIRMLVGAKSTWMLSVEAIRNPVELLEGKAKTYMFIEDEVKKYGLTDKDLVACAIDATGKYYWADNFLMRRIKLIKGSIKIRSRKKKRRNKGAVK